MSGLFCDDCGYMKIPGHCECPPVCECEHDEDSWPRPIPVTERLPELSVDRGETSEEVIARCECIDKEGVEEEEFWLVAFLCNDGSWLSMGCDVHWENIKVTHWLPLPPAPEPAAHE